MRRVSYYSLMEVITVMALMMMLGGVLYPVFHHFSRGFSAASREVVSKEIFLLREQFCHAVGGASSPLTLDGQKITAAGQPVVLLNGSKIVLNSGRQFALPGKWQAVLSLEDSNRLAVLTLTEENSGGSDGKIRSYRIVAGTGGDVHEK